MTTGRHWKRKSGVKWTDDICAWLKERCPAAEHGYASRREILDDFNAAFGTDFSMNSFVTHIYEKGMQLGFVKSNSAVPRGEAHWRHRPVGSLQEKKGYLRIKVAEPNVWMQYQRFVWEKSHPGESAEGALVIFMDGDNRNFAPENLERVSRGELCVMAEFGHTKGMTREERELCLLRARIAIASGKLVGGEKVRRMKMSEYYALKKNDPEFRSKVHEAYERRMKELRADPERYETFLQKQRERNRERRKRKVAGRVFESGGIK